MEFGFPESDMKNGTKVIVMGNPDITGEIAGTATEVAGPYLLPLVLVSLDKGFYNPEQTMFVRVIVAHPDCLTKL